MVPNSSISEAVFPIVLETTTNIFCFKKLDEGGADDKQPI
jgi:hypothetical protein